MPAGAEEVANVGAASGTVEVVVLAISKIDVETRQKGSKLQRFPEVTKVASPSHNSGAI